MKGELIFRTREAYRDGFIEVVIWRVPAPVPPSEHPFKYRLVYVVARRRAVGYDNERGKGDHRHLGERELPYTWISPQQLMADFMADVNEVKR